MIIVTSVCRNKSLSSWHCLLLLTLWPVARQVCLMSPISLVRNLGLSKTTQQLVRPKSVNGVGWERGNVDFPLKRGEKMGKNDIRMASFLYGHGQ